MEKQTNYKAKAHECHGLIVDGVRHEIDEFNEKQIAEFCDKIDKMAQTDSFLQECTMNAEGDDDAEYLCDLVDNWYKKDLVINLA